jgi:hypothetical protein
MAALRGTCASTVRNNHASFNLLFVSFILISSEMRTGIKHASFASEFHEAINTPTCCPTPADAVTNDELTKPMGPPFSDYYSS